MHLDGPIRWPWAALGFSTAHRPTQVSAATTLATPQAEATASLKTQTPPRAPPSRLARIRGPLAGDAATTLPPPSRSPSPPPSSRPSLHLGSSKFDELMVMASAGLEGGDRRGATNDSSLQGANAESTDL
ncbi:hypothetical protein BAE44_0024833 [Dichanthelium oligosanthes]|uniref:Uncharacterized protein n=1 Tax=Dichanthelium oligosanthes TaxID=888268 RepID=A0A1E5UMN5_9POAL|nr:hypothetical protein BAE44_0024833 [Dichanthelium oligosanthes]